jgi:hypothetical protein
VRPVKLGHYPLPSGLASDHPKVYAARACGKSMAHSPPHSPSCGSQEDELEDELPQTRPAAATTRPNRHSQPAARSTL